MVWHFDFRMPTSWVGVHQPYTVADRIQYPGVVESPIPCETLRKVHHNGERRRPGAAPKFTCTPRGKTKQASPCSFATLLSDAPHFLQWTKVKSSIFNDSFRNVVGSVKRWSVRVASRMKVRVQDASEWWSDQAVLLTVCATPNPHPKKH